MSDAGPVAPRRRRWPRLFGLLALLAFGFAWLVVSARPAVAEKGPPTAQSVRAANDAVKQIKDRVGISTIRLTNRELHGLATLAGDATGITRVDARVAAREFGGAASVPLPVGGWINLRMRIAGQHEGFPELRLNIGRIAVPAMASRWLVELARLVLRWRGAEIPPLDQVVRYFAVDRGAVTAEIDLPRQSGVLRGLAGLKGVRIDGDAVATIYCRLIALNREDPATGLDVHVRRAFADAPSAKAEDYNRAAFVSLAWFTTFETAGLAPGAIERGNACGARAGAVLLGGREDLAKHWVVSAALAAVFGDGAARAVGEWKELDDSLPDGSGFSFVDLAADRSALHVARRSIDPVQAAQERQRLSRITEAQLLPIALIAADEGLTEQQFLKRYGTVKADRYQATVARIDHLLAN